MKTRNQLENGYPKLLRIEPEDESSKMQKFFQDKSTSGSVPQRNPIILPERISPRGMARLLDAGRGFGNAAPMPTGYNQSSGSNGYVSYNYDHEQNSSYTPYPVYASRNNTKSGSNTSSGSNIYLGGRTSSYGPSGCDAVQKQYSFGRYSAGTRTDESFGKRGKKA